MIETTQKLRLADAQIEGLKRAKQHAEITERYFIKFCRIINVNVFLKTSKTDFSYFLSNFLNLLLSLIYPALLKSTAGHRPFVAVATRLYSAPPAFISESILFRPPI